MAILSTDIEAAEARPRFLSVPERKAIVLTAAVALTIFLLRMAWVSEHSYISLRVVDNFLHGHGLRWNTDDRVQAYTSPLFLAIVTGATWVCGNGYLASIAVSLLITLAALFLLMSEAGEVGMLTASAALVFSKAFMDFSVSGLENPLTNLAIAAYIFVYWRRRDLFTLSLIAALAATNRMDSVLLFLPSLIPVYARSGRRRWRAALLGWSPLILWSVFSLFYYGFPLSNPSYSESHAGIPLRDMLFQGIVYYLNALRCDAVTIFIIFMGLAIAYFAREWMLGLGVLFNLLYVIGVGGDAMSARLFSGSFFLCAGLIARFWRPDRGVAAATIALIVGVGLWVPAPTITSANAEFGNIAPVELAGVIDQRAHDYPGFGLLRYRHQILWPDHPPDAAVEKAKLEGSKVVVLSDAELSGYSAGPAIHAIDSMGTGDAFIARLPIGPGRWRAGHYERELPAGYVETLQSGVNKIVDPNLHEYWNHLHTVTSGDLFSFDRAKEVLLFQVGHYDYLLPRRK